MTFSPRRDLYTQIIFFSSSCGLQNTLFLLTSSVCKLLKLIIIIIIIINGSIVLLLRFEIEVKLRPTVSRPVSLGVRHPSGTRDQFIFLL
jgi:hypothetical protein